MGPPGSFAGTGHFVAIDPADHTGEFEFKVNRFLARFKPELELKDKRMTHLGMIEMPLKCRLN